MEYNGLPNEVLERICFYLCFHCQNPGIFPNSDTKESRADKVALAHLCRASKRLMVIAQPTLFHYYAAGNLPGKANTNTVGAHQIFGEEDDKLPLFVRTLVARPDLAACIRALQLQTSNFLTGCTPEVLSRFALASKAFGIPTPQPMYPSKVLALTTPTPMYPGPDPTKYERLVSRHHLNIHFWLQALSIALTPRLEMLLHVLGNGMPYFYLKNSSVELSALKTVALRGADTNYDIQDIGPLVAAAPNLDTLYALDCGCPADGHPWLGLGVVRKFVVERIQTVHLEDLLRGCHSLQDLEYYYGGVEWPYRHLSIETFASVRQGLRRLCFTHLPPLAKTYHDTLPGGDNVTITSLRDFPHLEDLVIDQEAVYSTQSTGADIGQLVELLPLSIQNVHLLYVHKPINADLLHLAARIPSSFPNLRSVKIGFVDVTPDRAAEMEQLLAVKAEFAECGVQLTWGEDFTGPYLYTAIPGGAPGMAIAHVNTSVPGDEPGTTVVPVPALTFDWNTSPIRT